MKNNIEENVHLRRPKKREGKSKSMYRGVQWSVRRQKWLARFTYTDKFGNAHSRELGGFKDERDAALAYDKMAINFNLPTNILKKVSSNDVTGTVVDKN
jgi:hypothetical protein